MFPKSNIFTSLHACMVFDPNLVHVDPEHPAGIEDDVQLPDVVVVAPKVEYSPARGEYCGTWCVHCENGRRCVHCENGRVHCENGLNIADVPTSEATPEEAAAKAHSSPAPVTPPTSRPNAALEVDLDMLFGERTKEKESGCRAS